MPPRKKRNSSKVNLIISGVFHAVVIGALFFFAAREGILGQKLKKIAVTMAPKEKPPEKPKEKPPEPKNEPPKASAKLPEPKQMAVAPKPTAPPSAPAAAAPPAAAPPAAMVPAFDFGGGKIVESTTDPVAIYKNFVEYTLRARWARPENAADENYTAEVELSIDPAGRVARTDWVKGSGDRAWDDSVRKVLAGTTSIGRPPPKEFPGEFVVRFDVQAVTETLSLP